MEPTYEDGDLVVVREKAHYDHGDIIAFRAGGRYDDPTRIIHRIVGEDPEKGFITQGDNRDRTDPWFPTTDDIIGRAGLHVPMAGDFAAFLAKPESLAALGGAAAVAGGTQRRRRRRSRAGNAPVAEHTMRSVDPTAHIPQLPRERRVTPRGHRMTHPRWAFVGLTLSLMLALPGMALTWSALRAPDTVETIETIGSVDQGVEVDYRFSGNPSAVYPSGVVEATANAGGAVVADGPLYSRLLDRLDVTATFRAANSGAERLRSTYDLIAEVTTPGGWKTTLDTTEAQRFDETGSETVRIDLEAVAAKVASVGELTGVGGDAYTVAVRPALFITGAASGSTIDEELRAQATFTVEGNLITPDVIGASRSLPLTRNATEAAYYSVGPFEMKTQPARAVLSGLALVLVAGIVWFASVLFGGVGLGEPARIAARYRSQMVDVAVATAPPGPVVMVGGIDELARIAKVEQSVILHEDLGDGAHRYRVFLGSVTYEYETAPEHAGPAEDDIVTAADEPGG